MSADQPDEQPKRRGATVPDASAVAIAKASLATSGFVPAQIAAQLGPEVTAELEAEHQAAREEAQRQAEAAGGEAPPVPEPTQEG